MRATVLSGVITAVIAAGVMAILQDHEPVGRLTSENFFDTYFRRVVQKEQRRSVWQDMLTPNFQNKRAGSFRKFQDHWEDFRKVVVEDVRKVHGENSFTMALTYTTKSGTVTEPNKVLFALTCDLLPDKLPWVPCESRDLQIDESEQRS